MFFSFNVISAISVTVTASRRGMEIRGERFGERKRERGGGEIRTDRDGGREGGEVGRERGGGCYATVMTLIDA